MVISIISQIICNIFSYFTFTFNSLLSLLLLCLFIPKIQQYLTYKQMNKININTNPKSALTDKVH